MIHTRVTIDFPSYSLMNFSLFIFTMATLCWETWMTCQRSKSCWATDRKERKVFDKDYIKIPALPTMGSQGTSAFSSSRKDFGEERRLFSRTAAGNRAYISMVTDWFSYLSSSAGPAVFITWSTYFMTSPRYLWTFSRNWIDSSNLVCGNSKYRVGIIAVRYYLHEDRYLNSPAVNIAFIVLRGLGY